MKQIIFSIMMAFMPMWYSIAQQFVPEEGKILMIIGQDLESVYDYTQDSDMPIPGGVTAYIDLYNCNKAAGEESCYYSYGGLGEDRNGNKVSDIDWGSGPLNASNLADGNPNSVLSIGLYMTEEWNSGGLIKIANGEYDAAITRLANFIKSKNRPVYLRIGYEFDGNWNIGYNNTSNFKAAYIRIVDIIRSIAPKCEMVLQACTSPVDDISEQSRENLENWYPGDEYVDWMGMSWFLSPDFTSGMVSGSYTVPSQSVLADEVLTLARNHNKPVMICESAPQGFNLSALNYKNINTMLPNYGAPATGQVDKTVDVIWNEWFKPYFDYIHANSDVIRAVAYINCNWDVQAKWSSPYNEGYWGDTRVQVNSEIKAKWLSEMSNDLWLHGSDSLFSLLGSITSDSVPEVITPIDTANGSVDVQPGSVVVPESGKTYLMIGQTFKQEYIDYVNAMGIAPAGSSHYGEIYNGLINQGDDATNHAFLEWMSINYPNAVCELALAIKDNPAAGGYDSSNPLWLHQACKDIADGKWDEPVTKIAETLASYPTLKFLVRIGYEVSLEPFAKCQDVDINEKYNTLGVNWLELAQTGGVPEIDPEAYKGAFQRVATILKSKCSNVSTVFHPVRDINTAKLLYPGDEYVDWCGLSVFNHDICWPTWENGEEFNNCDQEDLMDANFEKVINWMTEIAQKPVMISESAVQSHVTAQNNATHKIGYLNKIAKIINDYDIKAWVYINSDWSAHNWDDQWGDSRVETDNSVFAFWKDEVTKSRYIHYSKGDATSFSFTENDSPLFMVTRTENGFSFSSDVPADVNVYYMNGQLLDHFESKQNQFTFGETYSQTLYVIQVTIANETYVMKVVK